MKGPAGSIDAVTLNSSTDPVVKPMQAISPVVSPPGLVQQLPAGGAPELSQQEMKPLFVEVFSGKASFSRAMIQAGFEVVSVDHEVDAPYAPVVSLDLTTESGQKILMDITSSRRLAAIHFGLPCGTASKARDRPISQELQRHVKEFPRQLPCDLLSTRWVSLDQVVSTKPKFKKAMDSTDSRFAFSSC